MNAHDSMLDTVAAYALGALSAHEAAEVRAHLKTCEACREEYRLLAPAVTALAYSAEPSEATSGVSAPSALLKARVMKQVRASATPATSRMRAATWPAYALAAACLAIALVSGLLNLSLRERLRGEQAQITQQQQQTIAADRSLRERLRGEQAQVAEQRLMIADFVAPDAKRQPFARGEVLMHGPRLYVAIHDIPRLPQGKVYQAWTLAKGEKKMTPQKTFMPSSSGTTIVALSHTAPLAAIAVSVEPQGGSQQPTSKPVAVVML